MTQTLFTDDVKIDGSQNEAQLVVEGHSTQTASLQVWQNSAGNTLAQITGEGRLQVGDEPGLATPDALIEAHRNDAATPAIPSPRRGLHTSGVLNNEGTDPVIWSAHEVTVTGTTPVPTQVTALRAVVATDGPTLPTAIGVEVIVDMITGAITDAYGVKIADVNEAGTGNYALHTGKGLVHLGDTLELTVPNLPVTQPASSNMMRIYPKTDGKLYIKNNSGAEVDLTNPGTVTSVGLSAAPAGVLSVSGSPITGSGTLALSMPNQNANRVLAGPTSGGAAAPSFRNLVAADIPALSYVATVRENATNVVTNADTLDFKDFNVEDLGGGDAAIYHNLPSICDGRLTLSSGVPVPTSDVTAATNLYFTPFRGNKISLYDGTRWQVLTFSQLTLSLSGKAADKNYDIFAYISGGAVAIEISSSWTNNTSRTPNTADLVLQDGVLVKSGATTRRYLGTIRTTATTGQCEDSKTKRFVWNYYHRLARRFELKEATNTWTYFVAAWQTWRGVAGNRIEFVQGLNEDPIYLHAIGAATPATSPATVAMIGIGLDTSTSSSATLNMSTPGAITAMMQSVFNEHTTAGYHYLQLIEWVSTTSGATFYGDAGIAGYQSGASGYIKG